MVEVQLRIDDWSKFYNIQKLIESKFDRKSTVCLKLDRNPKLIRNQQNVTEIIHYVIESGSNIYLKTTVEILDCCSNVDQKLTSCRNKAKKYRMIIVWLKIDNWWKFDLKSTVVKNEKNNQLLVKIWQKTDNWLKLTVNWQLVKFDGES